jgi:quercetin dioxygenase-like cupin family protein
LNFNILYGNLYPIKFERAEGTRKEERVMGTAVPIIRGEGEGERRWFAGGGLWTIKARAEETDGAFILFEDRMPKGKTTPLHTHPHEDETFIVLEGEILVHVEGTEHPVGPGGVAVVPRGTRHAFLVTSEMARILALLTPGSGEAFYRDASEPSTDETDAERPADLDRLRAAAERNPETIQILGPPPFEAARGLAARAEA